MGYDVYQPAAGLGGNSLVIDTPGVIEATQRGEWFDMRSHDNTPYSLDRVLQVLQHDAPTLADFADTNRVFFVGTVHAAGEGSDWSIMPGSKDPEIARMARELYRTKLMGARAHFIVGPSGDYFTDSEHIGVMDEDTAGCEVAIDVTREDGLAVDHFKRGLGKLVFQPGPWRTWNGGHALDGHDDLTPGMVEVELSRAKQSLLESMRASLGR